MVFFNLLYNECCFFFLLFSEKYAVVYNIEDLIDIVLFYIHMLLRDM